MFFQVLTIFDESNILSLFVHSSCRGERQKDYYYSFLQNYFIMIQTQILIKLKYKQKRKSLEKVDLNLRILTNTAQQTLQLYS